MLFTDMRIKVARIIKFVFAKCTTEVPTTTRAFFLH